MIDRMIRTRKVIVTCGTGGVGKTTLSAAIAVRAATQGKKAVVITIDPAKRLATSLGLSELGDKPADITHLIPGKCPGRLEALMPDTRQTFDDLIRDLAPNPETANRIFNNPIFQIFAKEFSGANEYMAMQRLDTLFRKGDYDLIVLDTPPSRNTLAFLDAPKLLARFFDEKLIRWLVLPANKLVSAGMRKALGVLEKLTGAGFMTDLLDFATGLFEVRVTFAANLKRITDLLESESVGFLLVTHPTPETAPEIGHFRKALAEHRLRFDGVALNRTLGYLHVTDDEWNRATGPLREALTIIRALQEREGRAASGFGEAVKLPELARDVHSVEDLYHVAMALDSVGGS